MGSRAGVERTRLAIFSESCDDEPSRHTPGHSCVSLTDVVIAEGTPRAPIVAAVAADQAPLLARPYYGEGPTSPLITSLAHVPELLDVTMPFVATVLSPSSVSARIKELVVLRASALLECSYCVQTHTVVALDSGVAAAEVVALRDVDGGFEAFQTPADRALLAWVEAVAGGIGAVGPATGAALAEHFTQAEIVELTLVCAATMMLNRYCTALELPASAATLQRLADEDLA